VEIANKGASKSIKLLEATNFLAKIADTPTTKRMLAILDPITLAATISVTPLETAIKDEINSGKEVPKATMVTPIIKGERPRLKPILSALSKNQSAPLTNTTKEIIKTIIQKNNIFLKLNYI
jgi:hypothetical protein